jgi:ABC-type transport system substrate-binding protein
MYNAEEQPTEKNTVAQILQSQLKEHAIESRLEPVPNSIFYDRIAKGDFQAALALWYLDYNDPEGFLTDFYSKAGFRMSKYDNPLYDKVYLAALYAPDEAAKIQQFKKTGAILSSDLPWVPLYSNDEVFLLRKGAEGFKSNAYQYYDYRFVALDDVRAASDVEVQTLDPALAYDLASKHIVTQSYEGLVTMDENLRIIPALATEWVWSITKDSITFKLRPHVLFHNSPVFNIESQREMTAEDVRFSFERMLKSNSPYTYIFDYVNGVEAFKAGKAPHVSGFRAVDKSTFTINLSRSFPTMLPWLLAPAAYVLPKELPANYDFTRGAIGTGPFILKSFDGTVASLSANPDYWLRTTDGRRVPFAGTMSIRVIKDANTLLAALRQDQLDVMDVPLALFNEVFGPEGDVRPEWKGYTFREVKLNNLKFLAFNMQKAPWGKQVELRRKVSDAIDRQVIVQQVFKGKARVATSVIPSGVAGFD